MGSCWLHGDFQGMSCPQCEADRRSEAEIRAIEEQTEAEIRAIEELKEANILAIEEQTEAIRVATEEHRRNIAESWRLEAESKLEQAYELYKVGMYSDCLELARDAMMQDRSNINGYKLITWCMLKQGQAEAASEAAYKQIDLLRSNLYNSNTSEHISVLGGLPEEQLILARFISVLSINARTWTEDSNTRKITKRLVELDARPQARDFTQLLFDNRPSLHLDLHFCRFAENSVRREARRG